MGCGASSVTECVECVGSGGHSTAEAFIETAYRWAAAATVMIFSMFEHPASAVNLTKKTGKFGGSSKV